MRVRLSGAANRAVEDGDYFLVNGQKVWTQLRPPRPIISQLFVRTDPNTPKHKGISCLIVI